MNPSDLVDKNAAFKLAVRAALIAFLCALEDWMGVERSVKSRSERRRDRQADVLHERD